MLKTSGRIGLLKRALAALVAGFALLAVFPAAASAADENTFENVKANSSVQNFSLDMGGTLKVWAATLEKDTTSKTVKVALYGQLGLPYSSTDLGVEEFDGKLLLPDDNSLKYNEAISASLEWAPEDTNGKYDKTLFRLGSPIWVKGDSVVLNLKGQQPITVKIDSAPKKLDTKELEGAIAEHDRDYQAATSAGIKIKEGTDAAYKQAKAAAEFLVGQAKAGTAGISQDDLAKMRDEVNKAFKKIEPAPFNREPLQRLIAEADKKLAENGKDGKRYTKASYDALTSALAEAANLVDAKDLTSILAPGEAGPLNTHADFDRAAKALKAAIAALAKEEYKAPDLAELQKAFDEAVAKTPAKGNGWTVASRTPFLDAIKKVQNSLPTGFPYASQADVDALTKQLKDTQAKLVEEKLDPAKKVTVKFTYVHPSENGPTDLLTEPFKDEAGVPVSAELKVVEGQEVRIGLSDPLIKKFDGYKPAVFSLNSEDGSRPLARVLRDRDGRHYLVFKAEAKNEAKVASLQIQYVKGTPDAEPEVKPEDPKVDPKVDPKSEGETKQESKPDKTDAGTQTGDVPRQEPAGVGEQTGPGAGEAAKEGKGKKLAGTEKPAADCCGGHKAGKAQVGKEKAPKQVKVAKTIVSERQVTLSDNGKAPLAHTGTAGISLAGASVVALTLGAGLVVRRRAQRG